MATTPTYGFTLPTVGGDINLWGGYLNTNFTSLDGLLDGTATIAPDLSSFKVAGTLITATAAELNYTDGVTSAIQPQLDLKAPLANATFTGTPNVNGSLGIGEASPSDPLHITDTDAYMRLEDSNGVLGGSMTAAVRMYAGADEHGRVGFPGTASGIMYMQNLQGSLYIEADRLDADANSRIKFSVDDADAFTISEGGVCDSVGRLNAPTLRATSTSDVSLASTGHGFQVGPTSGENLRMDANEIMAANNGAVSPLYLNNDGGDIRLGNSSSDIDLDGTINGGKPSLSTLAVGAVGTYGFFQYQVSGAIQPGDNVAGADLEYAGLNTGNIATVSTAVSGTWKCMGYRFNNTNTLTVYMRII